MVRKKEEASSTSTKSKKEKPEKVSVMSFLQDKEDRPPPKAKQVKSKGKQPPANDYLAGVDLPPSDDEEEEEPVGREDGEDVETDSTVRRGRGNNITPVINVQATDRELKKREKKEQLIQLAQEHAKEEAMRDDDENAFSVVLGAKATSLDGEDGLNDQARDIKVENFSVSARGKELFRNASLTIVNGRRYGLVGPNGKGKSTIMKLLARRQLPVPKFIDVLLVEQEIVGDERTALEAVVSADEELMELRGEEARLRVVAERDEGEQEAAEAASRKGNEGQAVEEDAGTAAEKLAAVYDRMRIIGAESAEAKASKILAGLGFTKDMQARSTQSFSGGWRMRISLARALYVQPTLLLLDEPTNHLDLRAVIWLEEYLMRWKKTLIVVSHDRDFLNSVCTDIIHLHDEKLLFYKGNFEAFEEMYEQKRRENNKKFENYEKQLKAAKRSGSKASQDKGAAAAGAADDAPAEAPRRWRDYSVEFHFPEPTELTPPLMQLKEVSFSYPGRDDFSLKEVDVGIDMGTRVAIVGPNGAGKSTLLNLLAGDLQPAAGGESRRSQKLRIGRYSQHFVDTLSFDETPVQYLLRLYPEQEGPSKQEAVRAKLGKFGLPSHNHLTPIVKLSGGQKARVVFTSISMKKPHILLLDEPTNHLDMQASPHALADALEEFTGGVVLVSHDSRLISRVCDDEERSEIWLVDDGTVTKYPGSFDEYKSELIKEIIAEVEE
eukprot:jgi/Mesen1/7625/ME000004S07893